LQNPAPINRSRNWRSLQFGRGPFFCFCGAWRTRARLLSAAWQSEAGGKARELAEEAEEPASEKRSSQHSENTQQQPEQPKQPANVTPARAQPRRPQPRAEDRTRPANPQQQQQAPPAKAARVTEPRQAERRNARRPRRRRLAVAACAHAFSLSTRRHSQTPEPASTRKPARARTWQRGSVTRNH
jgi:hypothetical protein